MGHMDIRGVERLLIALLRTDQHEHRYQAVGCEVYDTLLHRHQGSYATPPTATVQAALLNHPHGADHD